MEPGTQIPVVPITFGAAIIQAHYNLMLKQVCPFEDPASFAIHECGLPVSYASRLEMAVGAINPDEVLQFPRSGMHLFHTLFNRWTGSVLRYIKDVHIDATERDRRTAQVRQIFPLRTRDDPQGNDANLLMLSEMHLLRDSEDAGITLALLNHTWEVFDPHTLRPVGLFCIPYMPDHYTLTNDPSKPVITLGEVQWLNMGGLSTRETDPMTLSQGQFCVVPAAVVNGQRGTGFLPSSSPTTFFIHGFRLANSPFKSYHRFMYESPWSTSNTLHTTVYAKVKAFAEQTLTMAHIDGANVSSLAVFKLIDYMMLCIPPPNSTMALSSERHRELVYLTMLLNEITARTRDMMPALLPLIAAAFSRRYSGK